ncbi:MAG: prepilin-type N-terminal cleavage/methylation domain-containing protein [Candidatus Gastranaerophilales bacterium]|nr:prepilin-type N-terminal cleavage/methylation domain-containing protein [Candidatus Gastranaerophilales bacterium]
MLILKSILSRRGRGVYAFTLAETLIALAIVGVVAMIVFPPLVKNVNEMSWAKAKDNFEVKIDQATRQMNVNGDLPSSPGGTNYITTEAFADNFQKYIKVAKRCTSTNLTDCFVSTFKSSSGTEVTTSDLTDGAKLGHTSGWGAYPNVGFSLVDGTNMILSFDYNCDYLDWVNNGSAIYSNSGNTAKSFVPGETTACVAIVYDINGNQKPNTVGKDIGELNAVLGDDDCVQVGSLCISKANLNYSAIDTTTDKTWDDSTCGAPVGYEYCPTNYWAGAKKACADLGMHLPSYNELASIYIAQKKNSGIKSLLNVSGVYWTTNVYVGWLAFGFNLSNGTLANNYRVWKTATRCVK